MRYVGITGFMSRAEVDACLAALPEGLTLMCGVLASEKSVAGIRNKWHRRYAAPGDIAGIFSADPRCLNLIHYCSDVPPPDLDVMRLQDIGGPNCHGFQFNGAYPEPALLRALKETWPTFYGAERRAAGATVVFQVRTRSQGKDMMLRLRAAVEAAREWDVHVLIDGSGGGGIPLESDVADAWGMMVAGCFGNDVGLTFAGGLDAERLPAIADEIRTWGASIDAEGRLRDGDAGGVLNLDKARAYLRAAGEIMGGTL